ncbi:putative sugar efflux transporter [Kitasatospora phosalacinea]|uniref:Sugar efflux transporter n=1 Tax=Kitasatospora phosalacinea TaxID=2065 RepID=A0A9W6V228_9ACTN|nr:MFS transporter [Kitasatospora phosalacinea]GLW69575.1 putative sugar efflux transporter [Kitasatospora phosalacinea]
MATTAVTGAPVADRAVPHRRAVAALLALSFAAFCFVTTEVLPTGLLTIIASDLGRSESQIGLLVTGYALVVLLASLPLAHATRRIPRRLLLGGTLAVLALATLVAAVAGNYWVLLVSRLLTGLTQAMFWAVVASTATGLFPPGVRGRMLTRLSVGNGLAPVLGVPVGTWLAQQTDWRVTFGVMSGLSAATCLAVALLLPGSAPEESTSARGTTPDRRRLTVLLVVTGLAVTGAMGTFTYLTSLLLDVSGFAKGSLGPLLSVSGVSGVLGTLLLGRYLDRYPWRALVTVLGVLTVALLGLGAFGTVKPPALAMLALLGLSFSALAAAVQHRALQVAPGSTDMASAATSAVFNLGIAAGSLLGAGLVAATGVRVMPLVGSLLTGLALLVMFAEKRLPVPDRTPAATV